MPFPLLDIRWEYKVQTEQNKGGVDLLMNYSLLGEIANLSIWFQVISITSAGSVWQKSLRCLSTLGKVSMNS